MINRDGFGRGLLTVAIIATPAFHLIADWSVGHFADPEWSAHAKYHLIVYHLSLVLFSVAAVYACWGRWRTNSLTLPLLLFTVFAFWLPFYFAALFPLASPYATQELAERGTPVQFFVGAGCMLMALVGWVISRKVGE